MIPAMGEATIPATRIGSRIRVLWTVIAGFIGPNNAIAAAEGLAGGISIGGRR